MDEWKKRYIEACKKDLENYTTQQLEEFIDKIKYIKSQTKIIERVVKTELRRRKREKELHETLPKVS